MPQRDDLAIHRVHLVQGLLKLKLDLGAGDRLAGGGEPAEQLGRQ